MRELVIAAVVIALALVVIVAAPDYALEAAVAGLALVLNLRPEAADAGRSRAPLPRPGRDAGRRR